jgi:predicted Zn finger-like uncharacterized protein
MANIRVTCPTCQSELEVEAEFEGKEVECGNCLQLFVAEKPRPRSADPVPSKKPAGQSGRKRRDDEDDRPRSRRRRRDDDDEDYMPPPERPPGGGGDGLAIASLILGIVALPVVCCWPLSIGLGLGATITGALGLKSQNNHAVAVIGLVLGVIALGGAGFIAIVGFGPMLFGR